jgi:lincosamide and streptogramin A transport system ATP-binding/permease protein
MDREITDKEGLLKDIEKVDDLKLTPLKYHKELLVNAYDLSLRYKSSEHVLFENMRFSVKQGDRVVFTGNNGCGKSSIISAIINRSANEEQTANTELIVTGTLEVASGMIISYVSQDTSFLSGSLSSYCKKEKLNESLLYTVLRKLDFEREQFKKDMRDFSEGQKKKVLIAASLITPAHLYIWDEPLNYIDVFSRMQIEKLIMQFKPTMIIVEHDVRFQEIVATDRVYVQ